MTNINLLITGPIRPNIDYVNYIINYFKKLINHNVIVFLGYWKDEKIDKTLIKNVDYIFDDNEPENKDIFEKITNRTVQQRQLHPEIEHWTPNMYKLFYGIRKLVEHIDNNSLINNDDIVLRIRTDLYVEDCNFKYFNTLLNHINKNTIYQKLRSGGAETCDWFSISSYNILKKIWYIENDEDYNNIIKDVFNAEEIIAYRSKLNKINVFNIKNIINICICRKYNDSDKNSWNPGIDYKKNNPVLSHRSVA